jgi:hypothetical protein
MVLQGVRFFPPCHNDCEQSLRSAHMLTVSKIETYRRFGGDIDAWKSSVPDPRATEMSEADWRLIEELKDQLAAAATGLASQRFLDALEDRLADCAADANALALLHELGDLHGGAPKDA